MTLASPLTSDRILRAHGGGGELMGRLIQEHILRALGNPVLNELTDGAFLRAGDASLVFTTDSYVVQPLEFPGGDIGRLAVCGTVNDLAVMGGMPLGLSLGLIIEEGFALATLDRILASIRRAADEAGVSVVTGDTKVIDRARGDGLFINTAGVGLKHPRADVAFSRIEEGDAILINGTLGDHGIAIVSVRNGLEFETTIESDAAPLNGLIASVLDAGVDVRFMRDATRGGVACVLADVCERSGQGVEIEAARLPRRAATSAAAELLGFDLLSVANEGKVLMVVSGGDADRCLECLKRHPLGRSAAIIGRVVRSEPPLVELLTEGGGRRVVPRPYGEELPRIC